ncbi:MAG: hypothetical protein U0228_00570 [Myxococcaceae bacterium]
MFTAFLGLHIASGALALASMAVPLFSVKGSPLHRRAGWVYVAAMTSASIAAFVLCALRLSDDDASNDGSARFLGFVALLALTNCWNGVRHTRRKARTGPGSGIDLLMPGSLAVGGVALLVDAALHANVLSGVFGVFGVFLGARQVRAWLRAPDGPKEWQVQHLVSLGAACIGTVTAVLVVNAARLGVAQLGLAVWVTPGVVGGWLIARASRRVRA